MKVFKGGTNEKISIWFRSNVSWCGIDVCIDARFELEGGSKKSFLKRQHLFNIGDAAKTHSFGSVFGPE